MIEALCSCETSGLTRATQRHIPEDGTVHRRRGETLKSYFLVSSCSLFSKPHSYVSIPNTWWLYVYSKKSFMFQHAQPSHDNIASVLVAVYIYTIINNYFQIPYSVYPVYVGSMEMNTFPFIPVPVYMYIHVTVQTRYMEIDHVFLTTLLIWSTFYSTDNVRSKLFLFCRRFLSLSPSLFPLTFTLSFFLPFLTASVI
jgi:hypothetical protein